MRGRWLQPARKRHASVARSCCTRLGKALAKDQVPTPVVTLTGLKCLLTEPLPTAMLELHAGPAGHRFETHLDFLAAFLVAAWMLRYPPVQLTDNASRAVAGGGAVAGAVLLWATISYLGSSPIPTLVVLGIVVGGAVFYYTRGTIFDRRASTVPGLPSDEDTQ